MHGRIRGGGGGGGGAKGLNPPSIKCVHLLDVFGD